MALALAAPLLAGCSEDDPGADGDVESLGGLVPSGLADELTESGRCGDGRLWAADDDGALAVVVEVAAGSGPSAGSVQEVVLPDDRVEVTVVHGDEPCAGGDDEAPGTQGRVEIERDAEGCVEAMRIDGLEDEDGTAFGPIAAAAPC